MDDEIDVLRKRNVDLQKLCEFQAAIIERNRLDKTAMLGLIEKIGLECLSAINKDIAKANGGDK